MHFINLFLRSNLGARFTGGRNHSECVLMRACSLAKKMGKIARTLNSKRFATFRDTSLRVWLSGCNPLRPFQTDFFPSRVFH